MSGNRSSALAAIAILALAAPAPAAETVVPNGSFEIAQGDAPQGWTLSGGKGQWTRGGK